MNEIIIYTTNDNTTEISVKFEGDTVWLSQKQLSQLFDKNVMTINEHINNIYQEGELLEISTIRKSLIVQQEGNRQVKRTVTCYNLDMIIAVGYRVNSKKGIQFRQWATQKLRDYLINGYIIHQKTTENQLYQLKKTVRLSDEIAQNKQLVQEELTGLIRVISDFTYALDILDKYDYQQLEINHTTHNNIFIASYDNAMQAICILKEKFGGSPFFAKEKDTSFDSSLQTIYQTFDGKELYPSIEEKAAMLLYLIVKNHSFIDGNKRIGAFLFLWFLEKNNVLYPDEKSTLLGNNTIVALTLMIAQSNPIEKDMMIKIIVNLINKKNYNPLYV